ncbi:MAG: ion transporter [Candidatus Peribacteria bacterium]|jgi:voltage-gated sodium channel|nr:ion transporter [Candidatus Peribacteria bacterium]
MKHLTKFFLRESNIHTIILLNVLVVLIQSFVEVSLLNSLEMLLTFAFFLEIIVKMMVKKKNFFKDIWDKIDFILCILLVAITILVMADTLDKSIFALLAFRAIRVLRVLRMIRFFKRIGITLHSFVLGLKASITLLPLLMLLILLCSILSMILFQQSAPEHFGNPIRSLITTLHIFIIEGWNEIPKAITGTQEGIWYYLVQLYFLAQLVMGGLMVFPMFLGTINDAMSQDDKKEQLDKIAELKAMLEAMSQEIKELKKNRSNDENPM